MPPVDFSDLKAFRNKEASGSYTPTVAADGSSISFNTLKKTDWWRTPTEHRRSAPILGLPLSRSSTENFSVGVTLSGEWKDLYDQAGLIVHQSEKSWIKCGVEMYEGKPWISVVVTNEWSDWSLVPLPASLVGKPVSLKIKREKADVMIFARVDDAWMALRHVPGFQRDGAEEVFVGIMACSPLGDGIKVEFRELWLEQ